MRNRPAAAAIDLSRRRLLLRGGAFACCAGWPHAFTPAFAQQSGLNTLPRHALVIGNSAYPDAPLRNPRNDAGGIAAQLKQAQFDVTLRLDADRASILEAIRGFGMELGKRQGVGLFYFAGHGVQLNWRNFLMPTDAVIDKLTDIPARGVDVAALLDGLHTAKNPMNVIIIDACRENPFGKDFRVEQKGLSQLDAPPGTLLAYATSPGNVASDGEGSNGLYTEICSRRSAFRTPR